MEKLPTLVSKRFGGWFLLDKLVPQIRVFHPNCCTSIITPGPTRLVLDFENHFTGPLELKYNLVLSMSSTENF